MNALLVSGQPPYANFALFGPGAARISTELHFQGLIPMPEGTHQVVRQKGPPSFTHWELC